MDLNFSRFVITSALLVSLTGCYKIPDQAVLNSSWKADQDMPVDADADWYSSPYSGTCPEVITNTQVDKTDDILPAQFSMALWNIYKQSNDDWQGELNRLVKQSDLLLLQEVKLSYLPYQLLTDQQLSWTQVEAFNVYEQPVGVLTAAKVAPINACKQTTTEPWIRFPKSSLITYYSWQGSERPLLVANLHLINFTIGTDEFTDQLSGVIDVINNYNGPVLMAGDFNTWTNKRLEILLQLTGDAGLNQASYERDERETMFGHTMDEVFFRGMRLISASSFATEASDHNPVVATFAP